MRIEQRIRCGLQLPGELAQISVSNVNKKSYLSKYGENFSLMDKYECEHEGYQLCRPRRQVPVVKKDVISLFLRVVDLESATSHNLQNCHKLEILFFGSEGGKGLLLYICAIYSRLH